MPVSERFPWLHCPCRRAGFPGKRVAWKGGAAVALAALVSACTPQWPRTTEEFRKLDHMFTDRKKFTVQKPVSAVNANLRAGTQKCLNGTQHVSTTMPGLFGGVTSESRLVAYNSTFDVTGDRGALTVRHYYPARPNAFGFPEGGRIFYVVDTAPHGGGTELTVFGHTLTGRDLDAAVREWASGGPVRCPQLPG
jgi:hypothetical protein